MKYIQSYFECLKDAGIDTIFQIFRMHDNEIVDRVQFDHVSYDGVSAMTELARKFPAEGFTAPKLTFRPKPNISKRLYELFKWYVRFYPFMPPKWKALSKDKTHIATGFVQVENWKKPDDAISINTKLLYALDIVSRNFNTNILRPRVWMTPVGLYDGIAREISPANRVSFIDIKISNADRPIDVQKKANLQLSELNYWGTMLTMGLPMILGKRLFTWIAQYMHLTFRRTGTFSNLGEWKILGLPENEWWVCVGCVAKMSPVEGMALVINDRLGLSMRFHPSLGFSDEDAQAFVEEWKKLYLSL